MEILQSPRSSSTLRTSSIDVSRFMSYVYWWMMIGLLITSCVAYVVASNPPLAAAVFKHSILFWGLILGQFGLVVVISSALSQRLSSFAVTFLYVLYSALTGVTFSMVFIAYNLNSVVSAFAVTVASFGGLSLYGFVTKRDLGPIASFCMMGLFGLIGAALLSYFIPSLMQQTGQMVMAVIGIIVFAGLTAYDTQKIKGMCAYAASEGVSHHSLAIRGALALYLDFINLFLSILRLMGDRK